MNLKKYWSLFHPFAPPIPILGVAKVPWQGTCTYVKTYNSNVILTLQKDGKFKQTCIQKWLKKKYLTKDD